MDRTHLDHQHTPQAIRDRLSEARQHSYLGDAVLGAIDGTVTTFAVISGVAGASLQPEIAITLGLANLLADGFSMAVSNYQRAKSEHEIIARARREEEQHIELIPEGEREEVRQIFAAKGLTGETLETIVDTITQDRQEWINTMLVEERGLPLDAASPIRTGLVTFLAFCLVGSAPLLPFLILFVNPSANVFWISALMTGLSFFLIGMLKGVALSMNPYRSALETLLMGSGAAGLAYFIGWLIRDFTHLV